MSLLRNFSVLYKVKGKIKKQNIPPQKFVKKMAACWNPETQFTIKEPLFSFKKKNSPIFKIILKPNLVI